MALIRINQLAEQLGMAVGTIHNQWRRKPHKFPPVTLLPGHPGPAWQQSDVDRWLEAYRVAAVPPKRRPGRPTNAERAARAQLVRDPRTVDFVNKVADGEGEGAK